MTPLKRFPRSKTHPDHIEHLNALVNRINEITPKQSPNSLLAITTRGAIAKPKAPSPPADGTLRFASTREYSSATSYSKNEIVIASPSNAAVTTGLLGTKAIAGMWVALKSVAVANAVDEEPAQPDLLPQWPPPGYETEEVVDPDDTEISWWPISFYPQLVTLCDSEEEQVQSVTNAQPLP